MKILLLTPRLPYPPDRGDRLRTFRLLQEFAKNHSVYLLSCYAKKEEKENLIQLQPYCSEIRAAEIPFWQSAWSVARNFYNRYPLQVHYYASSLYRKLVEESLKEWSIDVIYTHLFRLAEYTRGVEGYYKILDLTDVISEEIERSLQYRAGFSKLLYRIEGPRIRSYEDTLPVDYNECWVISDHEREVLRNRTGADNIFTVPNGIPLEVYHPVSEKHRPSAVISFVGHMGVAHNVDAVSYFLESLFRPLSTEFPGIVFRVIGKDVPEKIRNQSRGLPVEFHGFVADLNHYLNDSTIFVAPMRFCAGVQNKILEAMAAGCPVVTTSLGNQGIQGADGEHLFLGDDPETFIECVRTLLNKADLRNRMGAAGRKYVVQHFTWDAAHRWEERCRLQNH